MIIVSRFRGKFRERAPEWIMAVLMMWWGIIALAVPGLFEQPLYYGLELIMSQPWWGLFATGFGFARLIALLINGLWRPTPHIRAIGAIAGIGIWSSLLLASLTTPNRVLGVPVFAAFLAFDIMALWFASGDAKLADSVAKKARGG